MMLYGKLDKNPLEIYQIHFKIFMCCFYFWKW
jgi:hypothetical protein